MAEVRFKVMLVGGHPSQISEKIEDALQTMTGAGWEFVQAVPHTGTLTSLIFRQIAPA